MRRWPARVPAARRACEPRAGPGTPRAPGDAPTVVPMGGPANSALVISGDGHSEQEVGVTADQLRGGVHHDVGAEVQRLLQQRRGERAVDDEQGIVLVGDTCQCRQVDHVEHRIRRRLRPDRARQRGSPGNVERVGHCRQVTEVEPGDAQPPERLALAEQDRDPVVRSPGRDDQAAVRQVVEHRDRRGQPRTERDRHTAFEGADHVLQGRPPRVALARVAQRTAVPVRRRQDQRRVERITRLVRTPQRHCEGLRVQARTGVGHRASLGRCDDPAVTQTDAVLDARLPSRSPRHARRPAPGRPPSAGRRTRRRAQGSRRRRRRPARRPGSPLT